MRVRVRTLFIVALVVLVVLLPALAWGQEPSPRLPGQEPEAVRGIPFWLSIPMVLSAVGLVLLLLLTNWRYSRRFYGSEEAPPPRPRQRFAGMSAAQPAAAAPQGAPAAAPGATAASRAAGAAPAPPKPAAPPGETGPEPAPAQEEKAEKAEEPAAAEEKPAAAEEKPAAGEPAGPDQETFDRVLAEQLEKGVDRRVAEGRARAAALKASREKAGG
ncbi:MAG TPA: hypothetical protein VE754_05450 [Actinomycetota bacterium]|nr:hypothetical protein [Actinomycetota bacterium]